MKVKFLPQNVEVEIEPGKTIMALAHEKGIPIKSSCNGLPSCAECRVKIVDGDWNTNPPTRKELNLIGTGYYIDQRRLSCQVLCFGDVTVDISEQMDKASEGPITKKFLTKVHKSSAEESHSLGGVLIEQDGELMQQLENDAPAERPQQKPRPERPERPQGAGGDQRRRRRRRGGRSRNSNSDQ